MTHKRSLVALLAGTLVATGVALTPGTAAAAPAIDWQPCPDTPEVDCASIEVPLDWAKPDGEKIHIGLARRPAKDQAARIGSILMDPGGPGGSGVESVKGSDTFTDAVNARFDQVGFDPRGITNSSQLRCDANLAQQSDAAKHPTSQAEFDHLASVNRALHDSCRANSAGLAEHVDNLATVRDMDAIRAALGEEKLTYVGYSYGSLMGQQYAEMFPDRIRAFVMDGNMDHSLRTAWDFMRSETAPVEQGFVEFANWCDTTQTCALYGKDTKAVYADLKKRAKAGTLTDPDGRPMDFYALASSAFAVMNPASWGGLATYFADLRDGTATTVVSFAADIRNIPYPSIWCSDWQYPVKNYSHYKLLRSKLDRAFPNVEWSPYVDHAMTCVGSGTETTNPQRRLDIDDAPPLVMIGNVHDPATVYEWNLTAAHQSGAHLITYEGWGHTAYGNGGPSDCVNKAVDDYLINLKPPKRGLRCPATEVPASGPATIKTSTIHPEVGPYRLG
ncbi:alpha/beta hydrolase [Actinophytocola algeriensis]|uniref:Pimeloyl-ACP methyl ester carboxylesterase n=1 Tax=Actinophytocola algeriensis TaxID=1768010 RepID=A0A7W7QA02_9PSEU|nr:alpha/beta hydrolase [Actinophytocola algeriensis]MBB4909729.1 pimeloyl-ACP methyl ester carboxylesterase [Actinophytocola algeriensis]MBE1475719.1 pimeloyl-ACP methyl ester carboxylesterase [Actinophytocola algeriensis]